MARRTLVKLLGLVLLTFIICLSEFFFSGKVSQITFLCSPFDPCKPPSGRGHHDGQVHTVLDFGCESYALCEVESKNSTNQDDVINGGFVCGTESDLEALRGNASISEINLELILMLQTIDQNVTVHGHLNYSGVHIETLHNIKLLNCSAQKQHKIETPSGFLSFDRPRATGNGSDSTSETLQTLNPRRSNRSHYFLQMREVPKAPNDRGEWLRGNAVVWLVLVLGVIGVVLLSNKVQIGCCQKVPVVVPVPAYQPTGFSKRRVKSLGDLPDSMLVFDTQDEKTFQQKTLQKTNRSRDQFLQMLQETYRRGLSPIPEISLSDVAVDEDDGDENDDVMTAEGSDLSLDIPLTPTHIYSDAITFLHHRSHPSTLDSTT